MLNALVMYCQPTGASRANIEHCLSFECALFTLRIYLGDGDWNRNESSRNNVTIPCSARRRRSTESFSHRATRRGLSLRERTLAIPNLNASSVLHTVTEAQDASLFLRGSVVNSFSLRPPRHSIRRESIINLLPMCSISMAAVASF